MIKITRYLILALMELLFRQGYAQKTDWIQGFDNNATNYSRMAIDNNNDIILSATTNASFNFKGYSINTTSLSSNLIICKYSSDDSLKWLYSTYAYTKSQIQAVSLSCDENKSIYVLVRYTGTVIKLSKNDSLKVPKNGAGLALLKFSAQGRFLWSREFGTTVKSANGKANPEEVVVSQNHIFFLSHFDGHVHFQGTKDSVKVSDGITITCYDTSGNFKFVNIYNNFWPFYNSSKLVINSQNKNEIYFSGHTTKSFTSGSVNYDPAGYIFTTDTSGKILNGIKLEALPNIWAFTVDFNHPKKPVYASFCFRDTFSINAVKYKISGYHPGVSTAFARIDNFNKVVWTKNTTASSSTSIIQTSGDINIDKSHLYVCAILQGNSQIGGVQLNSNCSVNLCLIKFDSLGNVLWGFTDCTPGGSIQLSDSKVDNTDGSFYFTGYYTKKVKVFNDSLVNYSGTQEAFLAKVFDNSITRGNVKKGPYCAGDTFYVPYTKYGEYDTSNYFIAELSDENGDFEDKKWELGRIKSNKAGTIIGKLPLFQVSSSGNYRIRIRSTNPQVQSFYRRDSLRLLIYSRDKADPGPPETICSGNTIKLNTYGGTKWKWSPKYNMDNDTKRQPLVWPLKDTTYKIIISDSSGCGAPDTAYKKIIVRNPLKLTLAFNDTTVCDTSVLKIPIRFEGGDSTNYHWQSYSVLSSKSWQKTKSGKLKLKDTLFHIPKLSITSSQKLAIVLDDQCTNKKDTAYVNISLLKPEKLSAKFKDTTLCIGNTISWKAKPVYGLTKNSIWEWYDLTNDKVLSNNDSLSLTAIKTTKIKLILTNGCTIDSNVFTLNVNPPLEANILTGKGNLNDTSLCLGQSLKLFTKGNGGAGKGYNYTWKANGNVVSTKDSFLFKPILTSNFILTLILNDNCTAGADSISKTIKVMESPKANFTYGVACSRTNMDFKFTGSKPLSPVTTTFKWNFNNQDSSSNENPSYLFSTPGSKTLTLTLASNNGCKNEISKQIAVKVQSKADFDLKDICENDSAIFINKSQDATDYKWDFGDGSTGNLQSIKHKYSINGNPKTFDVKLVAIVKDGCSDSLTKPISVFESPKADFSTGLLCNLTTTDFKFTGTKPKSPVTTAIHWNFNNEDTSFLENPSHLFSTSGNKTLTLILTSNNGCTDTLIKTIEIKPKSKADFTANDVCETDSVVFINKSKDATGYTWKFGDGQTISTNPTISTQKHKYQINGISTTFNVTLVALVGQGCSDSVIKAVTINENPKSEFTYTNDGGKVDFKATQTGAKNYSWLFGNGDSAKVTNPDFSYTYKKSSVYNVCLKVINTAGCQSETCQQISITAGISPMARPSGFKIYPNPNTGNFTLEIENPSNDVSIEIYDLMGKLIKMVETDPNKKSYLIEISVAKGIYQVKVGNEGKIYNNKIIVGY